MVAARPNGRRADRADGLSTKLASNWPTALLQSLNCFILRHEAQCFAYLKLFSAIFNLLITHKILRISVIFFFLGVPAFMELRFSANFKPVKKLLVGPFNVVGSLQDRAEVHVHQPTLTRESRIPDSVQDTAPTRASPPSWRMFCF